jgi:hypothetical protein
MPQLMRRETPTHTGRDGKIAKRRARSGRRPRTSLGRSGDDAQQSADVHVHPNRQPRVEVLPRPCVHPDLPSLAILPTAHQDAAAGSVEIALSEAKRLGDSEPSTPQQDD